MSLAEIVLTQTQVGPHYVGVPEATILVSVLAMLFIFSPYLMELPLVRHG